MTTSRRTTAARWGGVLLLALAPLPWLGMGSATATPGNEDNVTICHRTNAVTNPYRVITVDPSAIDGKGNADHFGNHVGPVFDPEAEYTPPFSGDEWGDIIPPLPGVHDGLNWTTEGIAIWENGCKVGPVSSSPVETTSSAEESSEEESSSAEVTTEEESSSAEVTTEEESSSAEESSEEESSSAEVTTEEESSGEVTTEESSGGALPNESEKGGAKPQQSESAAAAALPRTGPELPVAGALGISLLLIGFGVLLLLGPGRLLPAYHRKH